MPDPWRPADFDEPGVGRVKKMTSQLDRTIEQSDRDSATPEWLWAPLLVIQSTMLVPDATIVPISGTICDRTWEAGTKLPQTRITNEWILDHFDEIYPAYRFALARLLVTLRREFGGDLDAMLVLLTLSLGTARQDWAKALLGELETSSQVRLTNTQSISQASGIPRETVRRKLEAMQARGWVERDGKGNWAPSPRAVADLRKSSQETVSFIRTLAVAIQLADAKAQTTRPDN